MQRRWLSQDRLLNLFGAARSSGRRTLRSALLGIAHVALSCAFTVTVKLDSRPVAPQSGHMLHICRKFVIKIHFGI